jgi:hypothetical protein
MPPREWTQIIAAEEDPAMGKSKVAGNGTNKMGELLGVLSPVATELVHLAGARFNMQNGFVVLRLVRCGSDHFRVRRTYRIDAHRLGRAIPSNYLPETCARGLRFRQSLCFSARMLWLHSIREPPQTSRT